MMIIKIKNIKKLFLLKNLFNFLKLFINKNNLIL